MRESESLTLALNLSQKHYRYQLTKSLAMMRMLSLENGAYSFSSMSKPVSSRVIVSI